MVTYSETKEFFGVRIPVEATKAAFGKKFGVYFLIGDEWFWCIMRGIAFRTSTIDYEFKIEEHIKTGYPIENV